MNRAIKIIGITITLPSGPNSPPVNQSLLDVIVKSIRVAFL